MTPIVAVLAGFLAGFLVGLPIVVGVVVAIMFGGSLLAAWMVMRQEALDEDLERGLVLAFDAEE